MSGDGHKAQRVAEFEELVNVGGRFLSTYKSELELFRRPPLQMKTTVIKEIMEANNSGWMRSYIEAGCRHQHTDIDNINKLNMCQQGIHEHIVKATTLLDELGCLMENVLVLVKEEIEKLSHYMDELQDDGLVYPLIRAEEVNVMLLHACCENLVLHQSGCLKDHDDAFFVYPTV